MRSFFILTALLSGLVFQPAFADPLEKLQRREHVEDRLTNRFMNNDGRIGPAEAARLAQVKNGGGRVVNVHETDEGYRVKLIKQGDVRVVFIPFQAE